MGIRDYQRILFRRWKTFTISLVVVFSAVAFYTYRLKPIYEASTSLYIGETKGSQKFSELGISPQSSIDSEIAIMLARSNTEQVVKQLHLDWQITKKSKGLTVRLSEFSGSPGVTYQIELNGPDSFTVTDNLGSSLGTGHIGILFQQQNLKLLISELKGDRGDGFQLSLQPAHQIAAVIIRGIKAVELGSRTNIIQLSCTNNDPVLARDIVNNLAEIYLEQSVVVKAREASNSLEFLETQLKSVQADLDVAEDNLQAYKVSTGVSDLDAFAKDAFQTLLEADKKQKQLEFQKSELKVAIAEVTDSIATGKQYSPNASSTANHKQDSPIAAAGSASGDRLAEFYTRKELLLTRYTESHPQVRALQVQIKSELRRILEGYRAALKNLDVQEKLVKQQISVYEQNMKSLPEAEFKLARLLRHTKVTSDIYTYLLQRYQEARIIKASTTSNAHVVDPAITPQYPILPNKKKNILLGFLFGCMTGFGLVFLREYLDDNIKDSEMARRVLGAPVLAVIPAFPRNLNPDGKSDRAASLVAQHEPRSVIAEAFRSLRTSIHFSAVNKKKQIMLVTSTFPGEGKTTIIANLAVTLVQTGARVILLDCDLRRPALHELFGHGKVPGITEILAGDVTIQDALHDTGITGLDFLSSGTLPPNPSELLGSEEMERQLTILRESYDYILIDAPPVLAVTDAPLLTARCDMVLVVLQTERVPIKAAQFMGEMLVSVRAPIAGLVINDKSGNSLNRYGYYGNSYNGYGYGYGYGEEFDKDREHVSWWQKILRKR
jgi:tyrosine-protein kinase Etk/Wzc